MRAAQITRSGGPEVLELVDLPRSGARPRPAGLRGGDRRHRSRAVVGFWPAHCMRRPEMVDAALHDLLAMVADGRLEPVGGGRYPVSAVREAHQDLLTRRTTGELVLDPSR